MVMPSSAIYRIDLASTFQEFFAAMERKRFITPRVLRPRMVGIQAADVGKIPIGQLLQTHEDSRASGGGYKRGDFTFDKYNYSCDEHGWEEPLDDRNLKIYADIFDAETIHAARAEDIVIRNYEIAGAAMVFDVSTWTGADLYTDVTNEWSDIANATPIQDVEFARRKIIANSGLVPNAIVMSRNTFWNAANCDQIVSRLKYNGIEDVKNVTERAMAEIWQVDQVIVAGGIKATNNEGQDFAGGFIWSDEYAMLATVATTDDPREPCIGRTFLWSEDGPGAAGTEEEIAVLIEEYREENRRGSVIRARNNRDMVIMYKQAGHLLGNLMT